MTDREKPPNEMDPRHLPGRRTHALGLDSHRAGHDGVWICGGPIWIVSGELAAAENAPPEQRLAASLWFGTTLVVLGVVVNVCAALQHMSTLRRLSAGQSIDGGRLSLSTITAMSLAVLGLLMAIFLGSQSR